MQISGTESSQQPQAPTYESAIKPDESPLWPRHLVDLFIRPRQFFSDHLALGRAPYVILVTWCFGIANAIDRIDQESLRAEFGRPRPGWESMGPYLYESWGSYWVAVLAYGMLAGVMLWYLGGWWYALRLRWSGAVDPDKKLARLLYVYSSFIMTGPTVVYALIQTLRHENYLAAYSSDDMLALIFLVFPFWSIACSYIGVRTLFDVKKGKALTWFAVLPTIVYLLAFGVFAALFAFLQPAS